ncbi:hypothetical protein [Fodinibius sp.]|uniref:hypothetical protein n=1 Tax=Fodinibius sp. TaxID=1872440 RepID=UPI002ACDDF9A|nr:hypothetical protein [Fodinibius sp.]MDZ7660743.1 hypothetical protein [Fodinibius sp.]
MPSEIKTMECIWVELTRISQQKLDLEERLEDWLEDDIGILSNDLLVIGRQVATDFGHSIDILCINPEGDLVVVELKRDKTPRDVTAQALDYGSWIEDLSNERVTYIANNYLDDSLATAFKNKFGTHIT